MERITKMVSFDKSLAYEWKQARNIVLVDDIVNPDGSPDEHITGLDVDDDGLWLEYENGDMGYVADDTWFRVGK